MEQKRQMPLEVIVAALFALILLPPYLVQGGFLIWTMDGGIFAYAGQQWLAGESAYLDFWDHKPPFIFLMNAIGVWLGQGKAVGIVAWAGLCAMGFAYLFLRLTRRFDWAARLLGLTAMFLWLAKLQALNSIGCFTLIPHLLILSAFVTEAEDGQWGRWALGVGICGGILAMARPNQALSSMVYVLAVLWLSRQRWQALLRYTAGVCLSLGFFTVLVGMRGSVPAMWDAAIQHNMRYAESSPLSSKLSYLLFGVESLGETGLLSLGLGVMMWGLLSWWRPGSEVPKLVLSASVVLAVEIGHGAASGKLYSHYLTPALPSCGLLLVWLADRAGKDATLSVALRWVAVMTVLILGLHVAWGTWRTMKLPLPEIALANRIGQLIPRDARTFIWTNNGNSLPFLLGRPGASRFFAPTVVSHSKAIYESLMPEILTSLETRRPAVIADCGPPRIHYLFSRSAQELGNVKAEATFDSPAIQQRLEAIAERYRVAFSDARTHCVVYQKVE
jgi:hypothetical protein